ncbi:glycosyltransferase family 2 protein [Pseudochryseolinea flava]|uniref:Glycosyltransferase family 2 protein n=1 Tax=Pseudochryseolinea flava TaxID=2059302 RepID=A0A364Y537_9BACT|nr:glycosyltransferase family 2 protein [Pseudochryseolinea flava]RAW01298.1 glycosyltransferase family 2 protein [Pseudochryseolinea flava]
MSIEISVVIPVYNAEKFLRNAVESCLRQPEVSEVVLVEDKSPDGSLAVCEALVKEYSRVKLFRHPGGVNKGAGPTRNLGMQSARCEYIAFLDADDYFLENRFTRTAEIFAQFPDADGVYEAVGIFGDGIDGYKLYTINRHIPPRQLFHYLLRGTYGHFSTNALTFRKSLLSRSGMFVSGLRLHQDSELWLRMAFHGNLYGGILDKPVTYVRRHQDNRIIHANLTSRLEFWQVVIDYFVSQPIRKRDYFLIVWKYCKTRASHYKKSAFSQWVALFNEDRRKISKLIF